MNYFLEVTWSNIFYNVVSIIIGLIVLTFGIVKIVKEKKLLFPIMCIVHALLFIAFGILGFFVPEKYDFLPILAILAFTITLIICFLTIGKKKQE
ncbi:MAG: hypothetical protein K6F81_05155 [Acholeplasmatales bacterium]|nr:hypothetical protein [Acholeplasmatales bacterium]